MKKWVLGSLALITFLILNVNFILADDEQDDGTIDLNTENIKNKKGDYSSLTDINGLNLFMDDFVILLEKNQEKELGEFKKIEATLFTNKDSNRNKAKKDDYHHLFNAPVAFDKTTKSDNTSKSLTLILVIGTLTLCILVFYFTRRRYKGKDKNNYENNSNIC